MQLNVLVDAGGDLHVQISSPSLNSDRHLFVPMLSQKWPLLTGTSPTTLVHLWFNDQRFAVPYLFIHSENHTRAGWKIVGLLDENDSRNILNHILDILAWD